MPAIKAIRYLISFPRIELTVLQNIGGRFDLLLAYSALSVLIPHRAWRNLTLMFDIQMD